jgi:hypothetical protein
VLAARGRPVFVGEPGHEVERPRDVLLGDEDLEVLRPAQRGGEGRRVGLGTLPCRRLDAEQGEIQDLADDDEAARVYGLGVGRHDVGPARGVVVGGLRDPGQGLPGGHHVALAAALLAAAAHPAFAALLRGGPFRGPTVRRRGALTARPTVSGALLGPRRALGLLLPLLRLPAILGRGVGGLRVAGPTPKGGIVRGITRRSQRILQDVSAREGVLKRLLGVGRGDRRAPRGAGQSRARSQNVGGLYA